jgi:hypothetical protein
VKLASAFKFYPRSLLIATTLSLPALSISRIPPNLPFFREKHPRQSSYETTSFIDLRRKDDCFLVDFWSQILRIW